MAALLVGCRAAPPPASSAAPSRPPRTAPEPVETPALNADEQTISSGLRQHAEQLVQIGERTPDTSWELAEAADYVAKELENLGYAVERQGYESQDVDLQNLSVTLSGGRDGGDILVVGCHYDSQAGGRGEAGAMAVAAVLELARLMKGARLTRSLKLVFFSLGESPHGDGEGRGARHFARKLSADAAAGAPPGTPEPLRGTYQSETVGLIQLQDFVGFSAPTGDGDAIYVHVATTFGSNELAQALEPALFGDPVRVRREPLSASPEESDVLAFFEQGIPAVSVFGISQPTSVQLDARQFERAARVVARIRAGISEIVGEKPQNDTMVTTP